MSHVADKALRRHPEPLDTHGEASAAPRGVKESLTAQVVMQALFYAAFGYRQDAWVIDSTAVYPGCWLEVCIGVVCRHDRHAYDAVWTPRRALSVGTFLSFDVGVRGHRQAWIVDIEANEDLHTAAQRALRFWAAFHEAPADYVLGMYRDELARLRAAMGV